MEHYSVQPSSSRSVGHAFDEWAVARLLVIKDNNRVLAVNDFAEARAGPSRAGFAH
jgi:hypothetical protein